MKIINKNQKKIVSGNKLGGNLFDSSSKKGVVIHGSSEDNKSAELLWKFISPYMTKDPLIEEIHYLVTLGLVSWNFSNMLNFIPQGFKEGYFKEMQKEGGFDKTQMKLIRQLIKDKSDKFNDYDFFIKDFELGEDENGKVNLSLICESENDFVSSVNEKLDFEEDEDDNEPGLVDRQALIIRPKQPFLDWLNRIFPDVESKGVTDNCIYLIEESMDDEEIERWLKENFEDIFVLELDDYVDEKYKWPANRTFKMFNEWFSYEIISTVYDMELTRIKKY